MAYACSRPADVVEYYGDCNILAMELAMKKCFSILISLCLWPLAVSYGQLASPNEVGVAMGHLHLTVTNEAAEKKLWLTLGGTLGKDLSANVAIKIPGVLILLREQKGLPTGGTEGSVIDHVGFRVPNVQAAVKKWQSAGLNVKPGARAEQAFVYTPDNLKLEILQDAAMTVPIAMDHLHFFVPESEVLKMKDWYAKVWGGKPGKRGDVEIVSLPGAELNISKSDGPTAKVKGRVLDHIGFEIKNLEEYCKKQEANGVKFDDQFYMAAHSIGTRHLTDHWGIGMELKDGQWQY